MQDQRASPWVAESCPHGTLNHFYGVFLLSFLCPIILICLVHCSPYLVYLRFLPCVHMSDSKMDPAKRTSSVETSLDMTPLWPPRGQHCKCVVRRTSDFGNEKSRGLCRVQPAPLVALLFSRAPKVWCRERISKCFTLGEAHLPPCPRST